MHTNKQMISLFKRQDTINKRLTGNKLKVKKLMDAIHRDSENIRKLEVLGKIEIHNGKLLDVNIYKYLSYGKACHIKALAEDNYRYAEIYTNAHNKKTFGAHLKVMTFGGGGRNELYLGSDWESFDDLFKICINFVTNASFELPFRFKFSLDKEFKKTVIKWKRKEK